MGNILSFVSDGAAVSAGALKLAIENNIAATVATIGLVIYFLCTAVVFIILVALTYMAIRRFFMK